MGSWSGTYYNNMTLSGSPVLQRNDGANLDFNWALGSPGPGVNVNSWSARWEKTDTYTAGTYTFTVSADDGVRVFVDGVVILDKWIDQAETTYTAQANITAGTHTVRVEFYENGGHAVIRVGIQQSAGPGSSWNATYFANISLSGTPALTRQDTNIDFSWGTGGPGAPISRRQLQRALDARPGLPGRRAITSPRRATTARASSSTGNSSSTSGSTRRRTRTQSSRSMTAGSHTVVVEYYERAGGAVMQFSTSPQPNLGGFVEETVVTGLDLPTVFDFAPDGRIFFGEKDGSSASSRTASSCPRTVLHDHAGRDPDRPWPAGPRARSRTSPQQPLHLPRRTPTTPILSNPDGPKNGAGHPRHGERRCRRSR